MKFIHLLLVSAFFLILMAGCTAQDSSSDDTTVKTATSQGATNSQQPETKQPETEQDTNTDEEKQVQPEIISSPSENNSEESEVSEVLNTTEAATPEWKYGGSAIEGTYADADIVKIQDGNYRMYYSAEPEVSGFQGQVYSATSSDGKVWQKEQGTRMVWATFPSVLKLSDGRYRMYFQQAGVIKSALSSDGINWVEEPGVRIDTNNNAGLTLENVAAPTVVNDGGRYVMVYRGTINQKYPGEVPNPNTQLFLWATSENGIDFEKKGLALDSRNSKFQGLLDGPELVKWDDGVLRLYFWTYSGVYHTEFNNNKFSEDAEFDYTTATNPNNPFPENPPGDPTVEKINEGWFMYYGQHTKGIYYAIYLYQN